MGLGSPELGPAPRSLEVRAVGRVLQEIFALNVRGWGGEGRGKEGAGKVFEEQKQWSILCRPAWVDR